jgi:hypothetical protein
MPIVAEDRRLLAALYGYRGIHKVDIYAYDPMRHRNNHYTRFYGVEQLAQPEEGSVILALVEKQETAYSIDRYPVGIFSVGNHHNAVVARVVASDSIK